MKKFFLAAMAVMATSLSVNAQKEYKVITTIESIVPGGIGRSRIIETKTPVNYDDFTTVRTDGKESHQGNVKRQELKVDDFNETKMLNFYSMVGINFQNIASNDALITSMLNKMAAEGWTLFTVISGVESDAGKGDGKGIFITRYVFQR